MIEAVEAFFGRMMDEANIKAHRTWQDETFEHKFTIKQLNIVNMLTDRVMEARANAGLTSGSKTQVANILKTKTWNGIYSEANIDAVFGQYFKAGRYIVSAGVGGSRQVTLMTGAFAETVPTKAGSQTKINAAMQKLWYDACAELKVEMGKLNESAPDLLGDTDTPETWTAPGHPGGRLHGEMGGTGFPTTVAAGVLAEGGGEGMGYLGSEGAVANFMKDFDYDFPGNEWLMEQATIKIFNPIAKTYHLQDAQDFDFEGMKRDITIHTEYGDNAYNANFDWADADGIKRAATAETEEFLRHINESGTALEDMPFHLKGSKTFAEKAELVARKRVIEGMFPHKTRPNMKFKVNKALVLAGAKAMGKSLKKGSTKSNNKLSTKKVSSKRSKVKAVRKIKAGANNGKGVTALSPVALRNILNEMLPKAVASKMTAPALRFRTGRFANSVRVDSALMGPRGGVHIDYTYQKNPYQTFEPGFKQGSTQRDPRKIIKESIREIAIGILGKQPHTIRRT